MERLGIDIKGVQLHQGLGRDMILSLGKNADAFGARGLLEIGRTGAAGAVLRLLEDSPDLTGKDLIVCGSPSREMVINIQS